MDAIGKCEAVSEFREAEHDMLEAREETRKARQYLAEAWEHFAETQERSLVARQDVPHEDTPFREFLIGEWMTPLGLMILTRVGEILVASAPTAKK